MNQVATQQVGLDNSLVASEKRLKNEKFNARIALLNQEFVKPHSEEELVTFIQELGYSGKCDMLSAIHIDQMHQPWRTFVAIINRCISGKTTGLDRLRELRAQILWGMYNKKNVDYVALLWEDFMTHDYQQYGALIPDDMINRDIKDSKAYKTYYDFATRKATPKKARKYTKVASPSRILSLVLEEEPALKPKKAKKSSKNSTIVPTTSVVIRDTPGVSVSKKKAPAKVDRGKGMDILSDASLLEAAQGDSKDDYNDDDNDDVSKGDDDKAGSDDDDGNDAQDSERTDLDEEENPNLNLKVDEEEKHKNMSTYILLTIMYLLMKKPMMKPRNLMMKS
nr:hypothetical protein [Tanacetum cinerariifolium]